MVSGEWLKGEMKRMRDDNLEFDSDKLDMQNIDFADVTHVHSPVVNTYVFDDRISATGRGVITPDKVIVETEEGTKTFPRSELESIVAGGEREKDWWSMKLRFGLTLNKGNTDQLTYDINFNTRREDRMTLLDLNYNASFGQTGGVQNVNRHLGEEDFKVFLSSRWFVVPLFGQLFNDRFQNIQFRATPAAGAGVHIIDKPKVAWDFQSGVGYQYLNYKDGSQLMGATNPQHDAFIPLYTYADFDITGDIDFTISWLTNLVVTTIGNTNHTGKADVAIELTSVLDLDIAFLYLRTEEPAPPPDPMAPAIKKNDYQLVVGIALELG
jgi:putative salt-induced outer membrane protein YdiY